MKITKKLFKAVLAYPHKDPIRANFFLLGAKSIKGPFRAAEALGDDGGCHIVPHVWRRELSRAYLKLQKAGYKNIVLAWVPGSLVANDIYKLPGKNLRHYAEYVLWHARGENVAILWENGPALIEARGPASASYLPAKLTKIQLGR